MPLKLNNLGMYLFPLNNKDIDGLQGNRVFPAIYNILYLVRADISLIYIVIKSLFKYYTCVCEKHFATFDKKRSLDELFLLFFRISKFSCEDRYKAASTVAYSLNKEL